MTKTVVSITQDTNLGGIAQTLTTYSKALALSGYEHTVILPKSAKVIDTLQQLPNVRLILLPKQILKLHALFRFRFAKHLLNDVRQAVYVCIHSQNLMRRLNLFPEKTAFIRNSRVKPKRLVDHNATNVFLTKASRETYLQHFPKSKANNVVINHAVDTDIDAQPMRAVPEQDRSSIKNQNPNPLRVLAAGRFTEKKGFIDLISAAELLQQNNVPVQINLVGDGELRNQFEQVISDKGLRNIKLQPWAKTLHPYFLKSDVLCAPSHVETFGLAMVEALQCGLPVVSTRTEGGLEIFGESPELRGGLVIDIGSVDQLVDALTRLQQDLDLRVALSTAGVRNVQENFEIEVLAEKLSQLINRS